MIVSEEKHLAHYGILRKSGRYPWGSGGTQDARNKSYLSTINDLKKQGMSEAEIARGFGISVSELRGAKSVALAQQTQARILDTRRLKEKGLSNSAIARLQGRNESSVRADLVPGRKDKADALQTTANMLRDELKDKKYIQVGSGVESQLGVTRTHLDNSIAVLKEHGYVVHNIDVQQVGTGKYTKVKVLCPPGTKLKELQQNRGEIRLIQDKHSDDYGRSFQDTFQTPISVSSRRVGIVYGAEGAKRDGVIYVRPGKKDLDLGMNKYGQVRIAVDGTHYLKGMAVYKDDLPDGVDLQFHTNKTDTGRKKDAMKPLKDDPDFPFGSIVRQIHGEDGKVSSAMNLVNEEGNWDRWSRTLSSQMLSKQSPELAKQQLNLTYERRLKELHEINSLTNPIVRRELLLQFADSTDSASVHLKAANLPRQANKVIFPIDSIKPGEVYAPTFRDGERVALVRFPHGGTFEIPELTVNNRNREARRILGTGESGKHDAIGIHHSVAHHLSGADFDGDTVLVIPNNKGSVKNTPPLEGLKGFDPMKYKIPDDSPMPRMTSQVKGKEMGKVSNLITDMTIHGANTDELARAIRHSMVVIDAEKHGLDWQKSEKDNGIASLKEKYQGGKRRGAATLISRARAEVRVPEKTPRRPSKGGPIDPKTGEIVYERTGRMRVDRKTGKLVEKTTKSVRLAETNDAFSLVDKPGTQMEVIYANHSNTLKALANTARKDAIVIKGSKKSPSAAKVYSNEVASLNSKLSIAKRNAPLEKQAQILANAQIGLKRQANPNMDKETLTKIKRVALEDARIRTGARKTRVEITQSEWDAIQAGAISTSKLEEILKHSNLDTVRQHALPKDAPKMTSSKLVTAKSMLARGYTQAEVADKLGVGLTTLKVGLNE